MRKQLNEWWSRVLSEYTRGEAIAAFRITTSLLWLLDLLSILPYHAYTYSKEVQAGQLLFEPFWFYTWLVALLFLFFGYYTKLAAICSFVCCFVFLHFGKILGHPEIVAQITAFYLIFADSGRCWSIDAYRQKRAGIKNDGYVWNFPILVLKLHVAIFYLDTALSHLLLNKGWQEGVILFQSLNQPHWNTNLGWVFARIPYFPELGTYASLFYELAMLVLVVFHLRDRKRDTALLLFALVGMTMHWGIHITLDVIPFGPQMMAVLLVMVPPRYFAVVRNGLDKLRETEKFEYRSQRRSWFQNLFVVYSFYLVVASMIVQIPVDHGIRAAEQKELPGATFMRAVYRNSHLALSYILGDRRPHNVFADHHVERTWSLTFEATLDDNSSLILPLLFHRSGERTGLGANLRVFLIWFYFIQGNLVDSLHSDGAIDLNENGRAEFELLIKGLVDVELSYPMYNSIKYIDVEFRKRRMPRSPMDTITPLGEEGPYHIARVYLHHSPSEESPSVTVEYPSLSRTSEVGP